MSVPHFAQLPILIGCGLLVLVPSAHADPPTAWSAPTIVAPAKSVWTRPVIMADTRGQVHVLWADRAGVVTPGNEKGDTLYHAMWDGREWSDAVPVLNKPARAFCLIFPDATVGSDDEIYAVWSGQSGLYFSHAPAARAHDPQSWRPAQPLVDAAMVHQSRIVRDARGRLHVIYTRLASDHGPAGNVFYVSSTDGGATWSSPVQLSRIPEQDSRVSSVPRLAIDQTGGLHAVWEENAPPNWLSDRIVYVHSADGTTWSEPIVLSGPTGAGAFHTSPVLATTGQSTLHLMWGCEMPPTRCYRVSTDGGGNWSPIERVFPQFVSMAGWDSLAVDPTSTLHLVAQLRVPYGMYHAFKTPDGPWHAPELFLGEKAFEDGHFVSAVATASDLHAVWQKGPAIGDVVYARMPLATADSAPASAPSAPSR